MATNNSHEQAVQTIPQRGFFGHPSGLGVLFFVEFWERFSYYGMRAMLIFYMYDQIKNGGLGCLLYTSPSPRDRQKSRMPSSA